MNKLILCEGKIDATLISYYLGKVCGWVNNKNPKGVAVKVDELKGESAYWYKKDEESLLICGVGGKDNFKSFFEDKILSIIVDSCAFSKIAVITDRDNRSDSSINKNFTSIFKPIIIDAKNNSWRRNTYVNSFAESVSLEFLYISIPEEKEGALETLLLDAISENLYDVSD